MQTLSPYDEHQIKQLLANYKLTPMTLAMRLNKRLIPARHLMYISVRVAHAIARGNGRLVISVPPRHGKSELVTKNTPIWALEHYGNKNVILTSYGAELSTDFGRKIRDMIQGNTQELNLRIRPDAQRVGNWLTEQGGAMMSVGLGGPITGRGADVLLIDDYIKEIKEAESKTTRDYIWDWFATTAFTRLEPGGTCIVIATRWHVDDLIGRILRENPGGKWENICIPAIAEVPEGQEFDFLGRRNGEALFPERYPLEVLEERKAVLGTYFFNALFQQRPEDENAKITDESWIKYTDTLPNIGDVANIKQARIWDLAATADAGDWTVGLHMILDQRTDSATIAGLKRKQLSPQKVEELVRKTALEDGPNCKIYIEQEPGASGKSLVEHYIHTVLPEFQVEAVPATDGKLARAQPFLAAVEAGRIFLYKGPWNAEFVDEFKTFPHGDHDDQVDTAAIGYVKLTGKKTLSASWGREDALKGVVRPTALDPKKHLITTGVVFGRRRSVVIGANGG